MPNNPPIQNFTRGPGCPAGHSEEEVRANLTLAAAAPELYDALELYVEHFGDPLKVARAALAKARGEQTDAR